MFVKFITHLFSGVQGLYFCELILRDQREDCFRCKKRMLGQLLQINLTPIKKKFFFFLHNKAEKDSFRGREVL